MTGTRNYIENGNFGDDRFTSWSPSGRKRTATAGEAQPSPIRDCPSSIVSYDVDSAYDMLTATLDLSRVYSPGWHGGPMESAPGARRVRRTRMEPIEAAVVRDARRW
jgi:hypothetical protein